VRGGELTHPGVDDALSRHAKASRALQGLADSGRGGSATASASRA
jgi:hypothetical protein